MRPDLRPATGDRVAVLLAADGAPWESTALEALDAPDLVVVRRCVDLADLLAAAASGVAHVAVVGADLPGLDAASVLALLRHDVRTVAVGEEARQAALRRLGVVGVLAPVDSGAVDPDRLVAVVRDAVNHELVADPEPEPGQVDPTAALGAPDGSAWVIWGPAGAPGRTTVATALAAELARRGRRTVLADLDPYGGAIAQQLGVLDEVSGVLAAARRANAGELDDVTFAACRRLTADRLELLTGLPRADRWIEVRDGITEELVRLAVRGAQLVADTGFCLEQPELDFGRPGGGRNRMTLEALACADEIVVVGAADPVGLSRLARGLVELGDAVPGTPVRVVVNRMRDRLGWAEDDIRGMVEGFSRPTGIHFLPDDPAACDRALVLGRAVGEGEETPLGRGIAALADALLPGSSTAPEHRRLRLRRGR